MTTITQDEIRKLVELQLGKRGVRDNDRLVEELGAESVDVANLVAAAEDKYGIVIKESEIANIFTPADLFELVQKRLNGS
jgi:acyl carrier protein